MEISSMSSALSALSNVDQGSLAETVGIKMLDNAISSSESMNASLTKMMERSVYPNLGGSIDVSV